MENIEIAINEYLYTLPPKSFMYDQDEMCNIGVSYDESVDPDVIYLGLPFFEAFVTRFQYERATISFGVNVNAFDGVSITKVEPDPKPDNPNSEDSKTMTYIVVACIFAGSLLVIIAIVFGIICIVKKVKANNEEKAKAIAYEYPEDTLLI